MGKLDFLLPLPGLLSFNLPLIFARASAGRHGQLDLEAGSGRGAVGGVNAAPGGLDDGAGDGNPQPAMGGRPAAVGGAAGSGSAAGAGGVAGLEYFVRRPAGDARPVVDRKSTR